MIEEFHDMMADEVVIEPWIAQNQYAEAVYGPAVTHRARIMVKPHIVENVEGQQIISTAKIVLGVRDLVQERDKITLPEGFTERSPRIIRVYPVRDEAGIHHIEVWV